MASGCLYRRKKKLAVGTLIEVGPYWMKWSRNGSPFSESTHQTEQEASNGTINRELAALQRAYTLAGQAGLLMRGSVPHIQKLKESNIRTGFFERKHFSAIHGHLPKHVKPVAAVAYITGWRTLSELLPLEWRRHSEA